MGDRTAVFGQMVWLASQSELHSNWRLGAVQRWFLPPLKHGFVKIFHRGEKPVGFASWAYLSEEVERAYVLNPSSLQPNQWKSGTRLWAIDFIAPFGDAARMSSELRKTVFPKSAGRFLRVKPGHDTARIFYFHGSEVAGGKAPKPANPPVLSSTEAIH